MTGHCKTLPPSRRRAFGASRIVVAVMLAALLAPLGACGRKGEPEAPPGAKGPTAQQRGVRTERNDATRIQDVLPSQRPDAVLGDEPPEPEPPLVQ